MTAIPTPQTRTEKEAWYFTNPQAFSSAAPVEEVALNYQPKKNILHHVLHPGTLHKGSHTQFVPQKTEEVLVELITEGNENTWLHDDITLHLAEEARLTHIRLMAGNVDSLARRQVMVKAEAGATYRQFTLTTGHALSRLENTVQLNGEKAHAELTSLNLLTGEQKTDTLAHVHFNAPHCTANVRQRNLVAGKGYAVFQGKFHVEQAAQKTDAYMLCQNILLNEHARAAHKPELEIYADDVKCSHGATTGTLDEEQLFYLQARGLSPAAAQKTLMAAQVDDLLAEFENAPMWPQLHSTAHAWLAEVNPC